MIVTPPPVDKAHASLCAPAHAEILSMRAKRRLAIYLRLRLLELREEGLEGAREVIRGRLRLEDLLQDQSPFPHNGGKTVPER
jgi:hypothetical protein